MDTSGTGNQILFKSGILEKNIFDQDMSSVRIIFLNFKLKKKFIAINIKMIK